MVATAKLDKKTLENLPIVGEQPKSEKEEKFLKEICEYEFQNIEEPGLSVRFPYGSTSRKVNFTMFHGAKYKIPRHVARHIESRSTPIWDFRPNAKGGMEKQRIGEKSRFQMRAVFS